MRRSPPLLHRAYAPEGLRLERATLDAGAYRIYIGLRRAVCFRAGRLGEVRLAEGLYVYVGSARRGLAARIARHRRLAVDKRGRRHWHVDGLLLHPWSHWRGAEAVPGAHECELGLALARSPGVSVPVPGFGATDCRRGCPAHLYRLIPSMVESLAAR